MKLNLNNIKGDPKFTYIGIGLSMVVILALLGLVYVGKTTFKEIDDIMFWSVTALLSFFGLLGKDKPKTLIVVLIAFSLSSCTTFRKCQEKYGETLTDTITYAYEKVIPKDSAVLVFKTDTLKTFQTIIKEENRARVIVQKVQDVYNVTAECDSITIKDTVKIPYEKQVFRNRDPIPFYKVWQNWVLIVLALIGVSITFKRLLK